MFRWLILCVVAALGLSGCKVYDPDLLEDGADAGPACELRKPPPRPDGADDGEDAGELVFALKEVTLDQDGERWRDIGFDLDGLCSIPPDPEVECQPPNPMAQPETDGNGGIDNAFGHQLYPLVAATLPDLESAARESEELGLGAIVVRVRGWNGEANDPRVDVMLSISLAGAAGDGSGTPPDVTFAADGTPQLPDGSEPLPPEWEGDDYFWLRPENFVEGDLERPVLRDDNAYVADNELVAVLPERTDILFQATEQAVLVRLTEAIATTDLSDLSRIPAMVAGRWAILDILQTAERVGICPGTAQYDIIENQLNRIADIRSQAGTGGPDVDCNAMSLGATFVGYLANIGGIGPPSAIPNACEAMMMDGGVPDAGPPDAGPPDAGPPDAGVDAGPPDAGG